MTEIASKSSNLQLYVVCSFSRRQKTIYPRNSMFRDLSFGSWPKAPINCMISSLVIIILTGKSWSLIKTLYFMIFMRIFSKEVCGVIWARNFWSSILLSSPTIDLIIVNYRHCLVVTTLVRANNSCPILLTLISRAWIRI